MENIYDELNISKDANQEEIKEAYEVKRLEAIKNNDGFLEVRLKQSYEEINTIKKKLRYDKSLLKEKPTEKVIMSIGLDGKKAKEIKKEVEQESEFVDKRIIILDDTTNEWKPMKGKLSSILINVDFLKAMRGCEQTVSISVVKVCKVCKNTQNTNSKYMYPCGVCSSFGYLVSKRESVEDREYVTIVNCSNCKNKGYKRICSNCNHTGFTSTIENLKIKIPKGTVSGESVILKSIGKIGENGGVPGDLLVNIKTYELKTFNIDENRNMYLDLHLTTNDLMNHKSFKIPSIDGLINLNINRNWNSSVPYIRKKNCGGYIKNTSKRGDLIVKVIVHLDNNKSQEYSNVYLNFLEKSKNV